MNKSEKALIGQLEKVPMQTLDKASFKALLRLQIFITGRTHQLMLDFGKEATATILRRAGDGVLDGTSGYQVMTDLLAAWGDVWNQWQAEFLAARREAVSIPYGVMAVRHERLVKSQMSKVESRVTSNQLPVISEAIEDGVFASQIDVLLNAAGEHLYGDGLNLSGRIWRIDREARQGITNVILQGITNQDSAWNVAKQLEQYLGAGQDCPGWTQQRLYGLTAKDKAAGDTRGLLSGNDCDGSGVSYKALRLARTEIQKAHALATDKLLMNQPWVMQEKCNLSAAHPEPDECDDVANGGEHNDGVYPVGTIEYPLHPGCFCFKTAVLMSDQEFSANLNGWLNGEKWTAMDEYKSMIGGDLNVDMTNDALSLAVWLFGDNLEKYLQ